MGTKIQSSESVCKISKILLSCVISPSKKTSSPARGQVPLPSAPPLRQREDLRPVLCLSLTPEAVSDQHSSPASLISIHERAVIPRAAYAIFF